MKEWLTIQQACEKFEVTPRTIQRWRETYVVRAGRPFRGSPLRLHIDDLLQASAKAYKANPARHQ